MGQRVSSTRKNDDDNNNNNNEKIELKMGLHRLSIKIDGTASYFIAKQSEQFTLPLEEGKVIKVMNVGVIRIVSTMKINDVDAKIYKFNIKIRGIFVPKPESPKDKEKHNTSKEKLEQFLVEKFVILDAVENGNNGVIICDVTVKHPQEGNIDLKQWILKNKLATENKLTKKKKKNSSSAEEFFDYIDCSRKSLKISAEKLYNNLSNENKNIKRIFDSMGRRNTL